jgi:adenylosuccinate synthase
VVVGEQRYALQLVPSGVLYEHVVPVIGNGVVVDLPTLFSEIDTLESRGISCSRLRVSTLAHLIFPWHQRHDARSESLRGESKLGTTLKGIGPAYADKVRRIGVRAGEARDRDQFRAKVAERAEQENSLLASLGEPLLDVDTIVHDYDEFARRLLPYLDDTVNLLHDVLQDGSWLLLEGAQATFLDIDHGTYPYVTSSHPTAGGACAGSGIGPREITRVVGIAKAYTTRVGSGPFPTEVSGSEGDRIVELGHEFGTVTGRRRRPATCRARELAHRDCAHEAGRAG